MLRNPETHQNGPSVAHGSARPVPPRPLTDRADELARLRTLLDPPQGRSVVLAGPPGVGRTTIAHAFVRAAADPDAAVADAEAGSETVVLTASKAAATVPLGAVAPLLAAPLAAPLAATDHDGATGRAAELGAAVAALSERSADHPVLVVVDDAHHLDPASATLLHQIVVADAARVLATVRSGAAAPDAVVALWKDGWCERVELEPMGPDQTGELLATMLGGPVDPASTSLLLERTRGNLVHLREIVLGALEQGALREDAGIWRLDGDPRPSARLVELVESELDDLDDAARDLVELVAHGEPLGRAELESLSDLAIAERLERQGVLAGELAGDRLRVRLAHPIVADIVRAITPAVRASAVVESLAGAIQRRGAADGDDVLQLATWGLSAGEADPDTLLDGATIAGERSDLPRAEALARAAADAGAGIDADLLAARVTALQGRVDQADADLAALAEQAPGADERGRAALARFDTSILWTALDGEGVLDAAAAASRDPGLHARIHARRLALVLLTEGPRAAIDHDSRPEAVGGRHDLAPAASDDRRTTLGRLVVADALARLGRLDDAIALASEGIDGASTDDDAWAPWWRAAAVAAALSHAGRFAEADALVAGQYGRALDAGADDARAVFAALEPGVVADRGAVRTAIRRAREALLVDRQLQRPLLVRRDLVASALAHALAGDAVTAATDLDLADALDLPPIRRDEADVARARAWTAAAGGDLPGARRHLDAGASAAEASGDLVGVVASLHDLARLGGSAAVHDRLAEVAAGVDGELAPARVAHTRALAHGDPAALDAVSARFDEMGADLLAAEAAADAAVAHQRAGDRRAAAASARRATELAARAEHPVTPALQAVESRAALTPAERETALLAAGGRANKEIAEQLHLSPRTVENRLQRVYDKLGVGGRGELAEALAPTA